ncbi:hypothetical protein [Paraburkholderia tropica]|uniref:hypothetical protein n=1 Tax=Paraburkholderia tropica TaxID=92647 RepID=UPI002ABD4187|nr:hypothetical protein [Paraburkholderia tropica]
MKFLYADCMQSNEEYQQKLEFQVFFELAQVVNGFQECGDLRGLVAFLGQAVRAYETSFESLRSRDSEESAHGAATGVLSAYLQSVEFEADETDELREAESVGFRVVNVSIGPRSE